MGWIPAGTLSDVKAGRLPYDHSWRENFIIIRGKETAAGAKVTGTATLARQQWKAEGAKGKHAQFVSCAFSAENSVVHAYPKLHEYTIPEEIPARCNNVKTNVVIDTHSRYGSRKAMALIKRFSIAHHPSLRDGRQCDSPFKSTRAARLPLSGVMR
ncbi:hypothetical protein CBM2634_U270003 [Cupriavidus taiwanensis]|uniref:Uncharacterized protein n=1 Tax=Cupriavidus taiwanensis TaxID=164546 RepID=A0A375JCU5_9BURK|nr:hypothetical protein CBM2634_U270003 [Cupriavidus taiwanensis]